MGCFGYICKCCGQSIRSEELCVMKHIRHDKVLGEVVGHYDEYGGVLEQDGQNDADINSHYELCQSEFDMDDSRVGIELRIYKGIAMDADLYRLSYGNDVLDKGIEGTTDEAIEAVRYINSQEFIEECEASFKELPLAPRPKTHRARGVKPLPLGMGR